MADVLATTRTTRPGVYIGRIFQPSPTGLAGFTRLPCLVGKGSRLFTQSNASIRRSYISDLSVTFTTVAPHTFSLTSHSNGDQTIAQLYTSQGVVVAASKWMFSEVTPGSGVYDQIEILSEVYDPNATYLIDYQSTDRDIEDDLPFSDLREIRFIGDTQSQEKYIENQDFYVPVDITVPAAVVQSHAVGGFTNAVASKALTGLKLNSTYTHKYNRRYTITAGAPPTSGLVTIIQGSGGKDSAAPSPIHTSIVSTLSVALTDGVATTFVDPGTGETISITLLDPTGALLALDTFTFTGLGASSIEIDSAITNTNQFSELTDLSAGSLVHVGTGTGVVTPSAISSYTGLHNRKYVMQVTAAASTSPTRTATIKWCGYGEGAVTQGSVSLVEATTTTTNKVLLEAGIYLDYTWGITHFVAADTYTFTAKAAMAHITAKDSRNYTLTCGTAAAGSVPVAYSTDTPEGRFGSITPTGDLGYLQLPGGINLYVNNIGQTLTISGTGDALSAPVVNVVTLTDAGATFTAGMVGKTVTIAGATNAANNGTFVITAAPTGQTLKFVNSSGIVEASFTGTWSIVGENRYVASDKWTFTTSDEEKINWTLNSRTSETISTTDQLTDALGQVTGTVGNTYVLLTNTPSSLLYVRDVTTGALLTASLVSGQPVVYFTTAPTHSVLVSYEYQGQEPDPGNFYYVTANTVREASLYNTPVLSTTWEQAQALLGPSAKNNDLLIAAQIALSDNNAPGIYTCQALDSDGDGVVTVVDVNNAILGTEAESGITDIIVLASFGSLSTAMASNVKCNDPFERKERSLWVGCPVSYTIGDVNTPGTLIYTSKKTLQVYGDNHAHGTRVLIGNPSATKTITLTDGTQVVVDLDGSFVAVAFAALNASFNLPSQTLLRQNISGFDSIQTYTETEELQLIGANIVFVSNQGSTDAPVFRIEESTTVDSSSADNWEISGFNQKQYVTKDLRESMDGQLIGAVPPSEQAGVAMIQGYVVSKLQQYIAGGIVSPYTNSNGTVRNIDPSTDVEVFRATGNPTLYHMRYWYNLLYPTKRIYSLYSVDSKLWNARA